MIDNNVFSHISDGKTEKKVKLNTVKESLAYIKKIFKGQRVDGFVKINAMTRKYKNEIEYTIKMLGRYYVLEFPLAIDLNEATDRILKKVSDLLETENKYSYNSMLRDQRRAYQKDKTGYFKEKNKMNTSKWLELLASNNAAGRERHGNFLNLQIKKNVDFLLDREVDYRFLLNELGHDGKEIESLVEEWYENALPDDSFMTDK